ncbi:hypothetical protein PORCRE_1195 [Porphyromonas crevioricanis JCM 15906]|uniref:Uncharacterized protein n=1 Tax=Porphyromonas crevioricanis JCM 15906 TaxID=1305617 RepID=T1CQY3_9PORP|nr:hypothetical protein PORCRE_1195 [Porphyromonas crevioricanis JCM 15906]GAD07720.1 hypothetical protein PORCAN_1344 [Porphyromonas crevioricanis JCM 13913]
MYDTSEKNDMDLMEERKWVFFGFVMSNLEIGNTLSQDW